jgi:hypothetical protein
VLSIEGQIELGSIVAGLPAPQPAGLSPISLAGAVMQHRSAAAPAPARIVEPPDLPEPAIAAAAMASPAITASADVAAPAAATASGNPWDLPSMSADAVASIRMATAAEVEPPDPDRAVAATTTWDESSNAAGPPNEPGPATANGHDPASLERDQEQSERFSDSIPRLLNELEQGTDSTKRNLALDEGGALSLAAEAGGAATMEPEDTAPPPAEDGSEPAESEPAAPAPVEDAGDAPAAAAPQPPSEGEWTPPRIHVTEFKGGVLSYVEPGRTLAEAIGALIEADYGNASLSRSFWWCETTPNGSAQMHTRQGLPDPYFFSRMLMWQPQ